MRCVLNYLIMHMNHMPWRWQ